jgi:serine O-acetyltransferase
MVVARMWRLSTRLHAAGHRRSALLLKGLIYVLFRALLPPEAQLGERLRLCHSGLAVVVHPNVTIGDDVALLHGVTLGTDVALADPRRMRIGDRVIVGVGAAVIGPITIGDDVVIGANAVVVADVPPGMVVMGNPATVIGRRNDAEYAAHDRLPTPSG